jgi:cytochrome c553
VQASTLGRLIFGGGVLVGAGVLAALGGAVFAWSGLFDVAATTKHSWPVEWLLHYVMQRSVALHAPLLAAPNLTDPVLILRGATHFASGCAPCHGAPGELASPIAQQMTPVPPGLYSADRDFTPSQLFWIVKNGVKMTAMPAWPAQQQTDEIWAMVAFLEQLPHLNTAAFAGLAGQPENAVFLPGSPPASAVGPTVFNPGDCARCHGADGEGRNGAFPVLAGMSAVRIEQALQDYRDGSRPSGFMQPVAATMSDAQIKAAAQYYAGLPKAAAP